MWDFSECVIVFQMLNLSGPEELHGHAVSVSLGERIGDHAVVRCPPTIGTQTLHASADDAKILGRTTA